ncbi:DNA-binding response regulator, partial [Salmonella enterica]|nr:DNA-binding response regulator [Salmonella enterica]
MTRLSQVLLLTHALIRVKFTRLTMWQIWTISALKTII